MQWDPERYLDYSAERARPFHDLMGRVAPGQSGQPGLVVDLGCGPATLTLTLAERWPGARVVGVDSSAEMIDAAAAARAAGVELVRAYLREWRPPGPVDVLVSNATLQWVPHHLELLPRLVSSVAPGGWVALQVPGNFTAPSHALLHELADSPRWRDRLGGDRVQRPAAHDAVVYVAAFAALGCVVDAWETTYLHVLPGEDPVLEWMRGTGLRPVLEALDESERAEFVDDYGAALRAAYPRQPYGTVLEFRRVFAVAQRGAAERAEEG